MSELEQVLQAPLYDQAISGPRGASAYEAWLATGHAGSQADFIAWVVASVSGEGGAAFDALFQTIGRPTSVAAGTTTLSDFTYIMKHPVAVPGRVKAIRVFAAAGGGAARVKRFADVNGALLQRGPDYVLALAAGANLFTAADFGVIPSVIGERLGIYAPSIVTDDAGGPVADGDGFYILNGNASAGALGTVFTNQQLQIGFDLELDLEAAIETAAQPYVIGKQGAPSSGAAAADYGLIFSDPAPEDSYIARIEVTADVDGAIVVSPWTLAGGNATRQSDYAVGVKAGLNVFTSDDLGIIPVNAGQLLGAYGNGVIASNGSRGGPGFYITSGNISPFAASGIGITNQELQLRFVLAPRSSLAEAVQAQAPLRDYLATPRRLRARMIRVTQSVGTVGFLADSIGETHYASTLYKHWVEKFRVGLIGDVDPNSETGVTNFGGDRPLGMAWYKLGTTGAPTVVNSGPVAQALRLHSGDALVFTGDYAAIAYCYDQAPGAGTLTLTRDGAGAAIDVQSTAGSAVPDVPRLPVATGHSGSATYRLTASGGDVTVTGLDRLGARAAGVLALRVKRFALSGQSTTLFANAPRLASIVKQATLGTTASPSVPLIVEALGANNAVNASSYTSPAQFQADLEFIYATLLAAGCYVVAIDVLRMDNTVWPIRYAGAAIDDYIAAKAAACGKYGVPLMPLDAEDFVGRGLTVDGLHPGDAGHARYDEMFTTFVAGPEFARIADQPRLAGRIDVAGAGSPEGAVFALGSSTYRRTDTGILYVRQAAGWGNTGWAAK